MFIVALRPTFVLYNEYHMIEMLIAVFESNLRMGKCNLLLFLVRVCVAKAVHSQVSYPGQIVINVAIFSLSLSLMYNISN